MIIDVIGLLQPKDAAILSEQVLVKVHREKVNDN